MHVNDACDKNREFSTLIAISYRGTCAFMKESRLSVGVLIRNQELK